MCWLNNKEIERFQSSNQSVMTTHFHLLPRRSTHLTPGHFYIQTNVVVFQKEMPLLFLQKTYQRLHLHQRNHCQKSQLEHISHLEELIHNISMLHQEQLCVQEDTKGKYCFCLLIFFHWKQPDPITVHHYIVKPPEAT